MRTLAWGSVAMSLKHTAGKFSCSFFCAAGFLAVAILLQCPTSAKAVDHYWNISNGDWSTPSNWLPAPGTEPVGRDYAYITNGGTVNIVQPGEVCAFLYVGGANTGTVEMTGGSFSTGSVFVGNSSMGTFNQSAGNNSILTALILGQISGSIGYYTLSGSGQLSAYNEFIGSQNNTTASFTQYGGTNTVTNTLYIASFTSSTGTYNLTGGTLITKSISTGSGAALFNFGGGTLQASGNITTTIPMTLTGIGGNANVNTIGHWVSLFGLVFGSGGLNKLGTGTLAFAGGIDVSNTTLFNVQSGKAILERVNINDTDLNITTAESATFEIVNCAHTVGVISGNGTTLVDNGASLSVASISQNILTMGSGATLTIQAIPGGMQSGTISPVPEPSVLLLLAGVLIWQASAFAKKLRR
jgi:hypothetical protein